MVVLLLKDDRKTRTEKNDGKRQGEIRDEEEGK